MFILNKENFSAHAQSILNQYYLQPLYGKMKANPQDGYIERNVHGAMHATRATVWALVMMNVLAEMSPDYVHSSLQKIAEFIGETVDTVKLVILFTMLCHDIAREGEGQDIWEAKSSEVAFGLLKTLGLNENHARLFANAIIFKDKRDDFISVLEKLNIPKEHFNAFDYIRKIINLGDNLDIVRCVDPFESEYIFKTLATVEGYDASKHDDIIMRIILSIHQFVHDQGDMLFDCDVENRNHAVVASHQQHISVQKKVVREHAENVFEVMLEEANAQPTFQPYLTLFTIKTAKRYTGKIAFDPFIHGTNSSILAFLGRTKGKILSPMRMLDKYGIAPMTGELEEGGYASVGHAAIKDETGHGKTSFAKMPANGNDNAYTLEEVIRKYTALKTSRKSDHLFYFRNALENGIDTAFSNINLLSIYFVRARLTHDSLDEVITEAELQELFKQLEATVQFFYFIQLLGIHIHPNFEALDAQPNRSYITEAVRSTLSFEYIVGQIIKHNIDMKAIVENPTESNLEKALVVLELPERITFKNNNMYLENYREKITVEPAVRQLFCLAPHYLSARCSLDPIYTFGKLSQNEVVGYKIDDVLYHMLRKQLEPEGFFKPLSECAKPHIIALKDRIRLFLKLAQTPQSQFQLTDFEKYFLDNTFPLVLVVESDDKMRMHNFTHQEFRSINALKLGVDIKMIATNTHRHCLVVMKYLAISGVKDVQVVLFRDLNISKLSKLRPRNPYQHENGVPKLQWLCAQQVRKHLPLYNAHYTVTDDLSSLYSRKNVLACIDLIDDVKTNQYMDFTGTKPVVSSDNLYNLLGCFQFPVREKCQIHPIASIQEDTLQEPVDIPIATPKQQIPEVIAPLTKAHILQDLNTFLDNKQLTKEMILDRFEQLKQKNGIYHAIHAQRNPHFDRFRLFFKHNVNAGEHYFWHTQSYQTAVKLLKNAYVKINEEVNAEYTVKENAFIDYVRGNALMHHRRTSTRKLLSK